MINFYLKIRNRIQKLDVKAFTLVEMLIAMSIFMIFTGILINSYASIVRSQHEANDYRQMYVEARNVFETLGQEFRNGIVDYNFYKNVFIGNGNEKIHLISKDAKVKTTISYDKVTGFLNVQKIDSFGVQQSFDLNSQIKISKFKIYASPALDPYDPENVRNNSVQFQPKITVFAEFTKDLSNGKVYSMNLQTTISSRLYSQAYPTKSIYGVQ